MIRNKKKRQGSALIVVLIFSAFFIAISSVSVMAVVTTFKANSTEEWYQTLYYEAEGGIAEARAIANSGDLDGLYDGSLVNPYQFDYHEDVTNDHVFVNAEYIIEGAIEYLQITSTAVKGGVASDKDNLDTITKKKRTVKAKIRAVMNNSELFKYSICGDSVNVDSGALYGATTAVNSAIESAELDGGSVGLEKNELFALPEFDDNKIAKYGGKVLIKLNSPGRIEDQLERMLDPMDANSEEYDAYRDSIKKVTAYYTNGTPEVNNQNYTVYMINADEVEIVVPAGSCTFDNTMILTNGSIKISKGEDAILQPSINVTYGTLVGKEVSVDGCSITLGRTPDLNTEIGGNINEGYQYVNESDISFLFNSLEINNMGIGYYAPNYSADNTPPTGASDKGKFSGYDYE